MRRLKIAFTSLAISLGAASMANATPIYQFVSLAPAGPAFNATRGTGHRSTIMGLNASGEVAGESVYLQNGAGANAAAWLYDNGQFTLIGLDTGVYQGVSHGIPVTDGQVIQMNNAGQVVGYSAIFDANGNHIGNTAWIYSGGQTTQLGLTGTTYQPTTPQALGIGSAPTAINDSGQVIGTSDYFNSAGAHLGTDAWLYSNGAYTQLGLLDGAHQVAYSGAGGGNIRQSSPALLNNNGQVAGISASFNSLGNKIGQDSWFYNGSATIQIGLTGPDCQIPSGATGGGSAVTSSPDQINDSGQVTGEQEVLNASHTAGGIDTWIYANGTTTQIGLLGGFYEGSASQGGTFFRQSSVYKLFNNGNAIGVSNIYDNSGRISGQDTWLYANGSTQVIGLVGAGFDRTASAGGMERFSAPADANSNGQIVGNSRPAVSVGPASVAWIYSDGVTTPIGATTGIYQTDILGQTFSNDVAIAISPNGMVIGQSDFYNNNSTALGTDGWFYNSITDSLSIISSGITDDFTIPIAVTDSGAVIGTFDGGTHAFWWDPADGFHDLQSITLGTIPAISVQSTFEVNPNNTPGGFDPWDIVNFPPDPGFDPPNNAFLLTALPEPTALLPLTTCFLLLLRRRTRVN